MANEMPDDEIGTELPENTHERLAALTRMVIFAREDALEVGAEFPAHCLDVAVAALLDEMRHRGIAFTVADFMAPEQPAEQSHMN
jgi:hypothetical protein